jgi:hypothetical protein
MSVEMPLYKKSKAPTESWRARFLYIYVCVCVWISFIFDFDMLSYFLYIYSICLWFGMYVQYHPDMNKGAGAEDKFKEISAAYEVAD